MKIPKLTEVFKVSESMPMFHPKGSPPPANFGSKDKHEFTDWTLQQAKQMLPRAVQTLSRRYPDLSQVQFSYDSVTQRLHAVPDESVGGPEDQDPPESVWAPEQGKWLDY